MTATLTTPAAALLPPTMEAAFVPAYGAPEVLRVVEQPLPSPGPDQVLVAVEASPVTQGDRRLRSGDFPGISWLPGRLMMGLTGPRSAVPGGNFAGRVVAVGAEVSRFDVGDAVFGAVEAGAHARYLLVAEDGALAHKPDTLTWAEAAALPYGGVTALHFLSTLGQLEAGERILIIGAAGGVGRLAVQLARHLGAEVTAVVSTKDAVLVRSLGAHHVIDRHAVDVHDCGQRWDVVLDPMDLTTFARARRILTEDGRYLGLHLTASLVLQMALTSRGDGPRALGGVAMPDPEAVQTLAHLAEQGAVRPVLDQHFPLSRIGQAHARLESGEARGTVMLALGQEG